MSLSVTPKSATSNGRRIWLWTAVVVSSILLLLLVSIVIGSWVARGAAINAADGFLDGISELAGAGRETAARIDERVGNLRETVGAIETAADQIAQNVTDRGLVRTLLPPEREQALDNAVQRLGETVESIRSVVAATTQLLRALDNLPFVALPGPAPEEVESLQSDVQTIRAEVERLTGEVQRFRTGVATEIGAVTAAAGRINGRLETAQQTITAVDSQLAAVQARTVVLKQQFRVTTFIAVFVETLIFAWLAYALIALIRTHWQELHS